MGKDSVLVSIKTVGLIIETISANKKVLEQGLTEHHSIDFQRKAQAKVKKYQQILNSLPVIEQKSMTEPNVKFSVSASCDVVRPGQMQ